MNWLDVVWLIVIAFFLVRGAMKGLFRELFGLLGVFVGLIVAVKYSEEVANAIRGQVATLSPQVAKGISFAIIFIGIALIGGLIGLVFYKMLKDSPAKGIDRVGGLILGVLEGGVVCSVILIFLTISPLAENVERWKKSSSMSPSLMKIGPFIYDSIASVVPGEAKKLMEQINEFR